MSRARLVLSRDTSLMVMLIIVISPCTSREQEFSSFRGFTHVLAIERSVITLDDNSLDSLVVFQLSVLQGMAGY